MAVESSRDRVAASVPLLGAVGSALWIAWIMIIYSVDVLLPDVVDSQQATSDSFVWSTLTIGFALVVLSFFSPWVHRHLLTRRALAVSSCLGAAATLVVINGPLVGDFLFVVSSIVTGCMTSLIALRIAVIFSEAETRGMFVGMGASLLLGILVYAFDMMLLLCGLWSAASVLLVLLLPLSACVLSSDMDEAASLPDDGNGEVGAAAGASADVGDGACPRLSAKLWRLIVFIAMLLFLLNLTRGYYPNLIDEAQFTTSRCVVALGLVVVAVVIVSLAWNAPRDAAFGNIFYGLLLLSVLVVLVLALLNVDPTVMGDVSSVLNGMTMLCLWGLLCRVSFRSGRAAVQVVGMGFGAACFGTTAGVAVGTAIFNGGMSPSIFTFVMAVAVILCVAGSLFLLRFDDVRDLMEPEPSALSDAMGDPATEEFLAARGDAAGEAGKDVASALGGYQASLQRLCAVVGVDYALSSREVDVLELLVVGKDAKSIADELFISFNTVRSHIRRIYVKLGVHSRQELLAVVKEEPAREEFASFPR